MESPEPKGVIPMDGYGCPQFSFFHHMVATSDSHNRKTLILQEAD